MPGIKGPLPIVIGLDMAAEIVELGAGVSGWRAGDRVLVNPVNRKKGLMGEMLDGGMAEYCQVSTDQLVAMPPGVTFEQATSLPVAYGHRAPDADHAPDVMAGQRVLILGASAAVGTGCVMLAKLLGAEVIACTSSPVKARRLTERWAPTRWSIPARSISPNGRSRSMASRSAAATTAASTW